MTLPNFTNINDINTFTTAQKYPDAKREMRIKLKRRYYSSGDLYDADWTTITSHLVDGGISPIKWGIDDQVFITGVTKSANVALKFDNTKRLFNDRLDDNSLWYDSTTNYYINNSLIEIDFGFNVNSVTYWNTTPIFRGVIKGETLKYKFDNTMNFNVYSLIDYFKSINFNDIYKPNATLDIDIIGLNDKIFGYLRDNLPSAFELTFTSNYPRKNVFLKYNKGIANQNLYDLFSTFAKNTGSFFCLNRSNEVFFTFFGNSITSNTNASFEIDTFTTNYFSCSETTNTAGLIDSVGSDDFTLTVYSDDQDYPTLTAGKFGTGRLMSRIYNSSFKNGFTNVSSYQTAATYEMLFKISEYRANAGLNSIFNIRRGSDSFHIVYDNQLNDSFRGWFEDSFTTFKMPLDTWLYLAVSRNEAEDYFRCYLNGKKVVDVGYASLAGDNVLTEIGNASGLKEIDSIRVSNISRTEVEINNNVARIFGTSYAPTISASYNFYNYGNNLNIHKVLGYDKGYTKIKNKISMDNRTTLRYYTAFYKEFTGTAFTFSVTDQGANRKYFTADSEGAFKEALESLTTYIATFTASKTISIYALEDYTDNKALSTYFAAYDSLGTIDINSTFTAFLGPNVTEFSFVKKETVSDFIFINSESVIEHGEKQEVYDPVFFGSNYSETALMCNSILDNKATIKERMEVETNLIEGNLDILSRVKINWEADVYNDNAPILYVGEEWAGKGRAYTAGAITWAQKDFYVIGINHDFNNNKSIYTLKEV